MNELKPSSLTSFIDEKYFFHVIVLDGQKLVADLISSQQIQQNSIHFFRSSVLSFIQMISLLKAGESLGVYIDSETPYYRFKLECNFEGYMRSLLVPEDIGNLPSQYNGNVRLVKSFENKTPYTSIVSIKNENINTIINTILKESYQLDASILISQSSDQSILVKKLPVNKYTNPKSNLSSKEYLLKFKKSHLDFFNANINTKEGVKSYFEERNLSFLESKTVSFYCGCSKERMLSNIRLLSSQDQDHLFSDDHDNIEVKCDYCQHSYNFTKNDIIVH